MFVEPFVHIIRATHKRSLSKQIDHILSKTSSSETTNLESDAITDLVSTSFSRSSFATFSTSALCLVNRFVVRWCAVLFDGDEMSFRCTATNQKQETLT